MSKVLYTTQCPECAKLGKDRKKNNLAVYADHDHCYSCGYHKGKQLTVEQVRAKLQKDKMTPLLGNEGYMLPKDYKEVEGEGLMWLRNYGITDADVDKYQIKWAAEREKLFFPVYDQHGKIVLYQVRNFNNAGSKYVTYGKKEDVLAVFGTDLGNPPKLGNRFVIVVEDFVSAMVVARKYPCMALFGSTIGKARLLALAGAYDGIFFWLDPDKKSDSVQAMTFAAQYFTTAACIVTDKDPKELTQAQIDAQVLPKWDFLKEQEAKREQNAY